MRDAKQVDGSFRDPSGLVFIEEGIIYRQVNRRYQQHYDRLISSGLFDRLTSLGRLVPHTEVDQPTVRTYDSDNAWFVADILTLTDGPLKELCQPQGTLAESPIRRILRPVRQVGECYCSLSLMVPGRGPNLEQCIESPVNAAQPFSERRQTRIRFADLLT